MSGRFSRLLTIAHLLPMWEGASPGGAAASRGTPARARRIPAGGGGARPPPEAVELAAGRIGDGPATPAP
jgi:hypothetical protein